MRKGFTLIELMIVMTVIAILATMVLYGLGKSQAAARDVARQKIMTGLQADLTRYYGDTGSYPKGGTICPGPGGVLQPIMNDCYCQVVKYCLRNNGYITQYPPDPVGGDVCTLYCTMPIGQSYQYSYVDSTHGQSYQLVLKKEAGGTSVFNSPQ